MSSQGFPHREAYRSQWIFVAELSVWSPRKLFIYHYLQQGNLEQRIQKTFLGNFEKGRIDCSSANHSGPLVFDHQDLKTFLHSVQMDLHEHEMNGCIWMSCTHV